jgi:hypothetical protein
VNEDEFAALRRWGDALAASDANPELRSSGRAILMLADEVERLNVEVWGLRDALRSTARAADEMSDEPANPPSPTGSQHSMLFHLGRRLQAMLPRRGA